MKKMYAFLTAMIVAVTAFAAPLDLSKAHSQLTPEGKRVLNERMLQAKSQGFSALPEGLEELGTRTYENADHIYTLRFMKEVDENQWWRILRWNDEQGNPIQLQSFEEFPFYNVMVLLAGYSKTTGQLDTYLPFFTFWPCVYWHSQRWEIAGDIPEDQIDYSLTSISALCEGTDFGFCNKFRECVTTPDGGMSPNPYMNEDGTGIEAWAILCALWGKDAGAVLSYPGAKDVTTVQSSSNIMEYTFRDYLPETGEINIGLKYPLLITTDSGTSRNVTLQVAYNGTCRVDFEQRNLKYEATALEIFNTGVVDDMKMGNDNPYYYEWGPLTRYYMNGVLNEYIEVKYPADMKKYNENEVKFVFKEDAPASVQVGPAGTSYFYGALYSAPDSKTINNQLWKVIKPSFKWDEYMMSYVTGFVPEAGTAIPSYTATVVDENGNPEEVPEQTYPQKDGLVVFYEGDNESPMENGAVKSSTTEGFNIAGVDLANNNVNIYFKGKIKFHNDPENAGSYEEIDAIGEGASVDEVVVVENAAIQVVDGKVVINAVENAEVSVYNVNGMLVKTVSLAKGENVALELGNGIFVVKAGNDVKKVVL